MPSKEKLACLLERPENYKFMLLHFFKGGGGTSPNVNKLIHKRFFKSLLLETDPHGSLGEPGHSEDYLRRGEEEASSPMARMRSQSWLELEQTGGVDK